MIPEIRIQWRWYKMYNYYKGETMSTRGLKDSLTKEMTFAQSYERWIGGFFLKDSWYITWYKLWTGVFCQVDNGRKCDAGEWIVCAKQWSEIDQKVEHSKICPDVWHSPGNSQGSKDPGFSSGSEFSRLGFKIQLGHLPLGKLEKITYALQVLKRRA